MLPRDGHPESSFIVRQPMKVICDLLSCFAIEETCCRVGINARIRQSSQISA